MRSFSIPIVFLIILISMGCSSSSNFRELPENQTTLHVINHSWGDRTIYILQGSHRIRLGRVSSMGEREFLIPDYVPVESSPLMVVADPVGSQGESITQEVAVNPGAEIQFIITQ